MNRLMKGLVIGLIGWVLISVSCSGGAAVNTAPDATGKMVAPKAPETPLIAVDPAEAPAEAALLAADWTKAYGLYTKLVLSNLKSPESEYYFYRLLWVLAYAEGTVGAPVANAASSDPKTATPEDEPDFAQTIRTIVDKPETNEPLRALALWIRANGALHQGDLKSAGADIDRLGFIKPSWFIGPFENEEKTGFKKVYPPEKELDLTKEYDGKNGTNKWFCSTADPRWGWVDMTNLFRLQEDVLGYALVVLNSPRDQEAVVRFGSDGALKLWLNDALICESETYRSLYLDQTLVNAKLVKGWNKLLIKSCQKRGPWRFMVRLTDAAGKSLTSLSFETDAEKIAGLKFPVANTSQTETKTEVSSDIEAVLKDKITANPRDAVSLTRAAFLYDTKHILDENDRKDQDYLKKAVELKPDNALWHLLLGWVETERNKRLEDYRQALNLAPQSPLAYFEFSRAYTGDLSWYKDLTMDWGDVFEAEMEGRQFDYEQEVRRAQKDTLTSKQRSFPVEKKEMEALEEALRLKPDFVAAKIALAKCYARRGGLWENEALRIFRELATVVPGHRQLKEAFLQADAPHLGVKEEIKRYEELFKDNYTDGKLRRKLVELYQGQCQIDKARELVEQTFSLNPYQYQNYLLLADIYRSEDKIAEGVKTLEAARGVAPEAVAVLDKLASFYHLSGDEARAVATWEELLRIRPQAKEVTEHLKTIKGNKDDFWKGYEENLTEYIKNAKDLVRSDEKESAAWLLNNQIIKVKPNGTSSIYVQQVIRVFDDNGRNRYQSVSAWPGQHDYYMTSKSDVKRATVIRKDGTEIEGQYYEDSASARFPRLDIDDVVVFECQIDEVGEARYKGYFGLICPFQSDDSPVKTAKITVISPKDKMLYFQTVRNTAQPQESEKDNLVIRTWTVPDITQIKEENLRPAPDELWPYLHISTFKSWDEVAEWIWGIAKDQFETGPEIKEVVKKAIEGKTTVRDKIKAIYQQLVSNVRYEEISLEAHHFKPFKANDTYNRKYGDCKDTATLLVTMLKEAGIPANIVLVRADPMSRGVVDTELPSMKIFNHMIAQVPDVDGKPLFLDGTARYCGAEELPSMDQGAVAFVVTPNEKGKCGLIPYAPSSNTMYGIAGTVKLAADNSAQIDATLTFKGELASSIRYAFQEGTKRELLLEQFMNQSLAGTKVENLKVSDIADYNLPVDLTATFKTPQVSRQEGNQMLFKAVLLPPQIFMQPLKFFTLTETRYYDEVLPCCARTAYNITYQIPAGYKIKNLPDDFSSENEYARCSINLKQNGADKITVEYFLETKMARIPRDGYAKFRQFCVDVEKACEGEIVLEK